MPPPYFFPVTAEPDETAFGKLAHFVSAREGLELNMAFARINSHALPAGLIRLVTALAEANARQDETEEE